MRKLFVLTITALLMTAPFAYAASDSSPRGPAPNSGDCIPDGSGFLAPGGPNAPHTNTGALPNGPKATSGDGIPDGDGIPNLDCVNEGGIYLDCGNPM